MQAIFQVGQVYKDCDETREPLFGFCRLMHRSDPKALY